MDAIVRDISVSFRGGTRRLFSATILWSVSFQSLGTFYLFFSTLFSPQSITFVVCFHPKKTGSAALSSVVKLWFHSLVVCFRYNFDNILVSLHPVLDFTLFYFSPAVTLARTVCPTTFQVRLGR